MIEGTCFADPALGEFTINGVVLVGPTFFVAGVPCAAWQIPDPRSLWEPNDLRGTDRPLPGGSSSTGVIPYPRRYTVTKRALPMVISGFFDWLGHPQVDPMEGLQANIDYLRANVADPTYSGDGTRPAVLTMPSGAIRTGNIHVESLALGNQNVPLVLATLNLSLPNGPLT